MDTSVSSPNQPNHNWDSIVTTIGVDYWVYFETEEDVLGELPKSVNHLENTQPLIQGLPLRIFLALPVSVQDYDIEVGRRLQFEDQQYQVKKIRLDLRNATLKTEINVCLTVAACAAD